MTQLRRVNIYDTSPIAVQPIKKPCFKTEWHKYIFCEEIKAGEYKQAARTLKIIECEETLLLNKGYKIDITV